MRKSEFLLLLPLFAMALAFPQCAESKDIPQGKLLGPFTFDQSKIFPGTVRKYWVYVPQQYDPSRAACVYIGQDGVSSKYPFNQMLDELIYKKEIPVMVGIFVSPGVVSLTKPGGFPRMNRSFEYNSLGDAYARFLLDELLPVIEREQKLNLSHDGNDRAIGGCSSGSSAAFTACWERPDAFRRCFNVSGAFPYARGTTYANLIRKYEAKPLRVFIQVGTNDMYNANGDLYLDSLELYRALRFAGYECEYHESPGGHGDKYKEIFPDGMRYLWKDWPVPVLAGKGPPRVQDVLLPDERWQLVGEGYQSARALAVNPRGEIFFSDTAANRIYHINQAGRPEVFLADGGHAHGISFGANGEMYTCSTETGKVLVYDPAGNARVFTDNLYGHSIAAYRPGGVFITSKPSVTNDESQIWFVDAQGEKHLADSGIRNASGLCVSADQWQLFVGESRGHWIYTLAIGENGQPMYKQPFFWLHVPDTAGDSEVDPVAVDRAGNVYSASLIGIQQHNITSHPLCIFPSPDEPITGLAFGGPQFDELYVTTQHKIFKRKVHVQGAYAFHEPFKLKGGKL